MSNFYIQPKPEWVERARAILACEIAAKGETITYGELYDRLHYYFGAKWGGARGRGQRFMNYLAPVLAELGNLNRIHDEPALSCLVHAQGADCPSEGYASAVYNRYGYRPALTVSHAQVEAVKCYKTFGA